MPLDPRIAARFFGAAAFGAQVGLFAAPDGCAFRIDKQVAIDLRDGPAAAKCRFVFENDVRGDALEENLFVGIDGLPPGPLDAGIVLADTAKQTF